MPNRNDFDTLKEMTVFFLCLIGVVAVVGSLAVTFLPA